LKTCTKCGVKQSLEEFWKDSNNTRDGRRSTCRSCYREYMKDPEVRHRKMLTNAASKYSLTASEYQDMLDSREGCDICGCSNQGYPCVDHCHSTHIIRGLLCLRCNVALGSLGDNIEGLTRALNYLKKGTTQDDDD
jgi:hypothetical protein